MEGSINMSTTNGSTNWRNCGGEVIMCDGNCRDCIRAEVTYAYGGGTSNSASSVIIISSPKE